MDLLRSQQPFSISPETQSNLFIYYQYHAWDTSAWEAHHAWEAKRAWEAKHARDGWAKQRTLCLEGSEIGLCMCLEEDRFRWFPLGNVYQLHGLPCLRIFPGILPEIVRVKSQVSHPRDPSLWLGFIGGIIYACTCIWGGQFAGWEVAHLGCVPRESTISPMDEAL